MVGSCNKAALANQLRHVEDNPIRSVIRLECNNVFDERYDVIRYYPMPGRSFKISITINNI